MTETDANGNGTIDTRVRTEFLNDANNHTGYSQVLRESHYGADTDQLTRTVDYTFGHAEISQTTREYDEHGAVTSGRDTRLRPRRPRQRPCGHRPGRRRGAVLRLRPPAGSIDWTRSSESCTIR